MPLPFIQAYSLVDKEGPPQKKSSKEPWAQKKSLET